MYLIKPTLRRLFRKGEHTTTRIISLTIGLAFGILLLSEVFALPGLLTLVIVLLTVSWQSWKATSRNPVDSLRYE